MKFIKEELHDGIGLELLLEKEDDKYIAFKLISRGDVVESTALLKEIIVENVDYNKDKARLLIQGTSTLEIKLNEAFILKKVLWDSLALEILDQTLDSAPSSDFSVLLLQETLAKILFVGRSLTITQAEIEFSMPIKYAIGGYETAMNNYTEKVLQAFLKHVDFNVVTCAVIASKGSYNEDFRKHLLLEAEKRQLQHIIDNKSCIIVARTSDAASDFDNMLLEALQTPTAMYLIKDTKIAEEVRALKEFTDMISNGDTHACQGLQHVEFAHEWGAIKTLFIFDEQVRNLDLLTRQRYANLVSLVKGSGGKVQFLSEMHVIGKQFAAAEIAAILWSSLPEVENVAM